MQNNQFCHKLTEKIKNKMKEPIKRLIVSLGSLFFIAGSLYVFTSLISPTFTEIQGLRGTKQAVTTLLADYEEAIEARNAILIKYEGLVALQDTFSEVMPSEENIPSLLNQLYGLASLNEVTVDSIDFQKMPIQIAEADSLVKPRGTIQATIRCVSNYENMKKYLRALETNVRLMNITSINITEGFTENPILSYTITVEAYYQTQ